MVSNTSVYTIEYPYNTCVNALLRWDKFLHSAVRISSKMLGLQYTPFDTCPENISLDVTTHPVSLTPTNLPDDHGQPFSFSSGFSFEANDYRFGGWSGCDIDSTGQLVCVSDEGFAFKANPQLSENGEIIGFNDLIFGSLKDQDGQCLTGKMQTDAEDVAVLPNGQLAVSFERNDRILIYDDLFGPAVNSIELPEDMLSVLEQFKDIFKETGIRQYGNVGIEALTVVDGHLMAVIEEALPQEDEYRVYIQNDSGSWDNMYYQGMPGYGISSATTLSDGNVLFLERSTEYFTGYEHYNCRIVEIDKNDLFLGSHFTGKELLRFDSSTADNFESVFTYTNLDGKAYVGITTDDNYAWSERNLFINFELNHDAAPAGESISLAQVLDVDVHQELSKNHIDNHIPEESLSQLGDIQDAIMPLNVITHSDYLDAVQYIDG